MAYTALGNTALWVNHIIVENPELARRLGRRIQGGMQGTAQQLNDVMARGGPIRQVVQEGRHALEELGKAIEAELSDRGN